MSAFKGAYRSMGYTEVENLLLMPNQYSGVVNGTWAVATGSFLNSHLIFNSTGNVIGGVYDELLFNQSLSGGIYNIIIRLKKHPKLFILTRPHKHSHNNLIYKIKFNGKIQSCSFN